MGIPEPQPPEPPADYWTEPPPPPVGRNGRPLTGGAARQAREAAERRAAVDGARDRATLQLESLASLMVDTLGIDLIRHKLGRTRAVAVLKLAGKPAEQIASRWAEQEPNAVPRQVSRVSSDYSHDPSHHPDVVAAILAGKPMETVNALMAQAAEEIASRSRPEAGPGHHPKEGAGPELLGVHYQNVAGVRVPVQVSTGKPWESYPDHQPEGYARLEGQLRSQYVPPEQTPVGRVLRPEPEAVYWQPPACEHPDQTGKHCTECGQPVPVTEGTPQ